MRVNRKIVGDLGHFFKMRYNIDIATAQTTHPELFTAFMATQYWIDEYNLNEYFGLNEDEDEQGKNWSNSKTWETRKSGQQLLQLIRDDQDLSPEIPLKILDVGCGDNIWKTHLGAKVTGIDPYNDNADFKIDITNYAKEKTDPKSGEINDRFDICLVLGSINFGDQATIERQIAEVVRLTKPGGKIYWRCNPGITHENDNAKWIDFFNWDEAYIQDIAKRVKCDVNEICWDHPEGTELRNGNRLYSEWTRSIKFN